MGAAAGYAIGALFSWVFTSIVAGALGGAGLPVLVSVFHKQWQQSVVSRRQREFHAELQRST